MKLKFKSIMAGIGLALAVAIPISITTGCQTTTQQKLSVNTITTTHQVVDAALDSYLDMVIGGKLATNGVPAVMTSYGLYQIAYNNALVIVLGNTNAPAPISLTDAATSFTTTVTFAKKGSSL